MLIKILHIVALNVWYWYFVFGILSIWYLWHVWNKQETWFKILLCPHTVLCLSLIRWITSSCFLAVFRTFPGSFDQSSCLWYHWYVWNKHDTPPDSRLPKHISLSPSVSLWWDELVPVASSLFPSQLYLKLHVQMRSVFVPALPVMSCVPT